MSGEKLFLRNKLTSCLSFFCYLVCTQCHKQPSKGCSICSTEELKKEMHAICYVKIQKYKECKAIIASLESLLVNRCYDSKTNVNQRLNWFELNVGSIKC